MLLSFLFATFVYDRHRNKMGRNSILYFAFRMVRRLVAVRAHMRAFWCNIHYATFGIISSGGVVTDTAPIANWMIGKTLAQIKPWLLSKKAIVKEI